LRNIRSAAFSCQDYRREFALGRNKPSMHRFDHGSKLLPDRSLSPAASLQVAAEPPVKADARGAIKKNPMTEHFSDAWTA
jgi:hypothetical protein